MIFYDYGEFVLTPSALYDLQLAYNVYFSNDFHSFEDWLSEIKKSHYQSIYNFDNKLVYMQTLPYLGGSSLATVIVILDKEKIAKEVNKIEWVKNNKFVILDKDNNVILSNSKTTEYRKDEYITGKLSKGTGFASIEKDTKRGYSYVLVLEDGYLNGTKHNLNIIFVYYILLAVIVGLCFAYLLARRNYLPIKDMIQVLEGGQKRHSSEIENEFVFIDTSIKRILTTNKDFKRQLELTNVHLQQNFISRLLRGRINIQYVNESFLSENHIEFPYDSFIVSLIKIDEYSDYLREVALKGSDVALDNMDFLLNNSIRELLNEDFCGYVCEANAMIAVVINFAASDSEKAVNFLYYLQKKIADEMYIETTVSASNIHGTYLSLQKAYSEACMAMECSMFVDNTNVILFSENDFGSEYYYSTEIEQALSGNLRAGNYDLVEKIIFDILKINLDNNKISIEMFRCLAFDIAATFIRVLEKTDLATDVMNAQSIVSTISKLNSAEKLRVYLLEVATNICETINSGKESNNTILLTKITSYIKDNYANTRLSNVVIADELGITPTYLSRFFKQQTGDGLLNYINAFRINEAKKRICTGDKKYVLNKLCAEVGFDNVTTFIRCFKKYEGMTPGKYAEIQNQ